MAWRGGPAKARSTTRLPAALREELGLGENGAPESGRRPSAKRPRLNAAAARKEQRKEQRHAKLGRKPTQKRDAWRQEEAQRPVQKQREHVPVPKAPQPKAPQPKAAPQPRAAPKAAPKPKKSKAEPEEVRTVMDPITGEMRTVTQKKASKGPSKLEQLMERTGQRPLDEHEPVERERPMTAAERDEEDEIKWLEYQLYGKKKRAAPEETDDLDCMWSS